MAIRVPTLNNGGSQQPTSGSMYGDKYKHSDQLTKDQRIEYLTNRMNTEGSVEGNEKVKERYAKEIKDIQGMDDSQYNQMYNERINFSTALRGGAVNNRGSAGSAGGKPGANNPTAGSMYGGAFNLNSIMEQFYNWKPDANDDEGRAIKNTTQADMVNSAFQTQLAQMMAQSQAGISKDMMNFQSLLEREAAGEARKEEFDYGMQSMGAQFEHQNNYANAQHDRDLGMLGATGEQERLNIQKTGNENRLLQITKGEQDRLAIGAQGSQDRMNIEAQGESDIAKIKAQGTEDRANINTQQQAQAIREQGNISAQGTQDRENIRTQQSAQAEREVGNIRAQGEADQQNIITQQGEQGKREQSNIKTQGSEDRANILVQQGAQGERERGNIGAQGEQDRKNIGAQGDQDVRKMEKADELGAKKANRQQARARSLARAF